MLIAFSVAPSGTGAADGSVHDAVAAAVRVVRDSGLPNRTTSMFTELEGEWDEVFDVVKRATEAVLPFGSRVSLVLKADIRPGRTGRDRREDRPARSRRRIDSTRGLTTGTVVGVTTSTSSRGAAMWALLSLAIGSFGIGMTEFVVMGLLPDIAQDLLPAAWAASPDDAIAQAGWLITLYALGVVVGAPTIAGLGGAVPAASGDDRARARAHALQRADLRAPHVRARRRLALPRGAAARCLLRHRGARRGRRARPRQSRQGRGLRAHRTHRRERGRRAPRHLPRPAGRAGGPPSSSWPRSSPSRRSSSASSSPSTRGSRGAPCARSSGCSGWARCGRRSRSAPSASAGSSPSTAMSPPSSPRSRARRSGRCRSSSS